MYLQPAWKQINSLIPSSDLDTSKANHVTLTVWLTLRWHLFQAHGSLQLWSLVDFAPLQRCFSEANLADLGNRICLVSSCWPAECNKRDYSQPDVSKKTSQVSLMVTRSAVHRPYGVSTFHKRRIRKLNHHCTEHTGRCTVHNLKRYVWACSYTPVLKYLR